MKKGNSLGINHTTFQALFHLNWIDRIPLKPILLSTTRGSLALLVRTQIRSLPLYPIL